MIGFVDGVVAFDGKTLRGSGKKGSNELLHLVTADAVGSGRYMAQEGTYGKGHEFAKLKNLRDVLILKGGIATTDALGCQTEIAEKIVDQGGDDILPVKDNPKNLVTAIRQFLRKAIRQVFDAWMFSVSRKSKKITAGSTSAATPGSWTFREGTSRCAKRGTNLGGRQD